MKELYLIINIASVLVPFLFSFHPKIQFYKKFNSLFAAIFIALIVFIPWDILFTHLCVWGFNSNYVLGIYFLNLPVEEVLFFICIPYSCAFTYHCFNKFISMDRFIELEKRLTSMLVIFLSEVL